LLECYIGLKLIARKLCRIQTANIDFLQLCHQRLSVLYNYFDDPTKLFSDLAYSAKFSDTSTKFP